MTEREREMRNSKSPGPVGSRRSRRRTAPYWTKRGDANSATRRAVRDYIESPAEVARTAKSISEHCAPHGNSRGCIERSYIAALSILAENPSARTARAIIGCGSPPSSYSRAAWASRLCRHSLVAVGARADLPTLTFAPSIRAGEEEAHPRGI